MADKQAMYIDFMKGELTIPELAEKHCVPLDTAKNWIYRDEGGWKYQRDMMEQEQVLQAVNAGSRELSLAWKTGADIYMKWLEKVNNGLEAGAFSAKELVQLGKTIPDGLKVLHPMLRLEMNKSTANVEVQQQKQAVADIAMPDDIFNVPEEIEDDRE